MEARIAVSETDSVRTLLEPETNNQKPYPPVSSIPQTSSERLAQFAVGKKEDKQPETMLYLAYGSNMCAQTFMGMRGVRPLSQINVTAPSLRLTLTLPGIPYREPCFANVDYREIPEPSEKEKLKNAEMDYPPSLLPYETGKWDGSLIGVVYEVTQADYRNILRTEGGGSGYKEIQVPCLPIPTNDADGKPSTKQPKPFLARTLFAAYVLDDPSKDTWWKRMTTGHRRPEPERLQASKRYMKLLTDGAAEHDLPREYQDYLGSLQPYASTTKRQFYGGLIFSLLWGPLILSAMRLGRLLADDTGRYPLWFAGCINFCFNTAWFSYDVFFKHVFGDGERTEKAKSEVRLKKEEKL
ncbi:hypothetical protein N3K66_000289 [Trichothecium roseum]|uniref:Uncharacterized protein n=1 Tax=Trichothecium roseum TaxID=47278 RepID=A0ACC0VBF7_9HYPO|nr:hypothetical protein N3K66_000289 [Trichothecium roseum]